MFSFFVACAVLGGAVLVLQLLASLIGLEHGAHELPHDAAHDHPAEQGLSLLSVRALAAGVAFFGLAGMAVLGLGRGIILALAAAVAGGGAAMVVVALLMRSMLRMESDGTVRIADAVGATGTVYLTIPPARGGLGKVHLPLQGRTVELQALTPDTELPTGASILVIDIAGPDTVVVVGSSPLIEASDAVS
ncbi:MAG TPA: hypothetical protein VFS05_01140 [Gemmatimonadaceae bacterium]|nr:hypothetical protein [Gemmatimonadaceae bacterium]